MNTKRMESQGTAEGRISEGRTIPVMTPGEHLLNISTIAAGLIISPQNPLGTIGADAMLIYHALIEAYLADPDMPR